MIVTTCPRNPHNGVWRHLKELEESTHMTIHIPAEDLINGLPTGCELVIFGGGWNNLYNDINNIAKSNGVPTSLLFCSPFGQMDLCNEHTALLSAIDLIFSNTIRMLFVGEESVANNLKQLLKINNVLWLPQTMSVITKTKIITDNVSIGLFCNTNQNKNLLNQLIAVGLTKEKLVTNALTNKLIVIADELSINYETYEWLSDSDYNELMRSSTIGLQVSWSEAFDYVAAEMSLLGIPVVTGATIDWNLESLKVINSDNPNEIALKINNTLKQLERNKQDKNDKLSKQVKDNIIKELNKRANIAKENLTKALLIV